MNTDHSAAYNLGRMVGTVLVIFIVMGGISFFVLAIAKACTKKTKGWIITAVAMGVIALVGFVSLGVAFVAGMSRGFADSKVTQLMTSKDGLHRLTVPTSWKSMPGLNAEAQIGAGNEIRDQYAIAIIERKSVHGMDLATYAKTISDALQQRVPECAQDPLEPVTAAGRSAMRQRMTGVMKGHKVSLLQTYIDMPDHIAQILCWTATSRESSAFPMFEKIVNTFAATGQAPKNSDRVRDLVMEQFNVSPATLNETTRLTEDLGADELDNVELVMAVEEEFNVSVSDEEAEKWKTVGDIIRWVDASAKSKP